MAKNAIDPSIAQHYAEKSAKSEARAARALTAEHTRRVKHIFAEHIAQAAMRDDKSRISELKLLQSKLATAIKAEHYEGAD